MKKIFTIITFSIFFIILSGMTVKARTSGITFKSLLLEMAGRTDITYFPFPEYKSLQSSSYNRQSVSPDKPGWFADSDGVSWIREETIGNSKEYVIMEHEGPGCITRMWTPFFYYSFDNRTGPHVKIYLDGNKQPVIDENFIALLTGKGTIKPPFASYTARAGVCFLPIPFSKSCKITLDDKGFYNIINYRAYSAGTEVETFSQDLYLHSGSQLAATAKNLSELCPATEESRISFEQQIGPGDSLLIPLPEGERSVNRLTIRLKSPGGMQYLHSTVLKISFDGHQTVWCPVGDFFCSTDTINQFLTKNLTVSKEGTMTSGWVMPYASKGQLSLINFQQNAVTASVELYVGHYKWDDRSMYFHVNIAEIGVLPGDKFFDMNFVNIHGKGVLAGDALTVLSPGKGWWGEGDEKIYIDQSDLKRKFPTHFGTGTEDYYGWAGGVNPNGKDVFSMPFGSNVRVGNLTDPSGYNVCMRNRILDAIPFTDRLVFDMEASPGTDIRNYWNLLSYSAVTYWYGMPGATSGRAAESSLAREKRMTVPEIERLQQLVRDSVFIFNQASLENRIRSKKVY